MFTGQLTLAKLTYRGLFLIQQNSTVGENASKNVNVESHRICCKAPRPKVRPPQKPPEARCFANVKSWDIKGNWWKGEMKSVKYPSKGGIFDYFVPWMPQLCVFMEDFRLWIWCYKYLLRWWAVLMLMMLLMMMIIIIGTITLCIFLLMMISYSSQYNYFTLHENDDVPPKYSTFIPPNHKNPCHFCFPSLPLPPLMWLTCLFLCFGSQVKDAKFEEWSSAVESLEYSSETPMGEVTVPWMPWTWPGDLRKVGRLVG